MDALLTTRQLQDLLQVDRITIYRMLNDGRLQGFKVGGQWRFSRQTIERWLEERRGGAQELEPTQPADDVRPSADALPLSCVQTVQDVFAEALAVGMVTTTVDGIPVTPVSNCCEFCDLILHTGAGRQRCVDSWRAAAAEPAVASPLVTCHAGLLYAQGRIEVRGQFVAVVDAGQFLDRVPEGDGWPARIRELAAATGLEAARLQDALKQVPVLSADRQRQVAYLLSRVAAALCEIGEERLGLLSRLQRIAEITTL
jgi:excisionase family DNA binding protein